MKRLNSKWLLCAVVTDHAGNRAGTVAAVNGDRLTVLSKGVVSYQSANELNAKGRINKNLATDQKYI